MWKKQDWALYTSIFSFIFPLAAGKGRAEKAAPHSESSQITVLKFKCCSALYVNYVGNVSWQILYKPLLTPYVNFNILPVKHL